MQEAKRVAKAAIICDGSMLLGRRRDDHTWAEPGGHLEDGESPLHGVIREIKEETGLDVMPRHLTLLKTKHVKKPDGKKLTVYAYKAWLPAKAKTTMGKDPDKEVHRWHWIPCGKGLPAHIAQNLHTPLKHNVLHEALAADRGGAFWSGFRKAASFSPLSACAEILRYS